MSEGNLPRNPAENASGLQNDRKRQELLRDQAQKKFLTIDVGDDGKSNGKDHEYRQEALNFITKECLGLPNERFKELVEKIAEILKRKDVEKEKLSVEFARARAEIMKEARNAPLLKDAEAILSLNRGTHLMSRIWENPEMLARIYVEWGSHHPAYEEIKKMPGGNETARTFDQAKMSIEANYRLSRFDAEIKKNPSAAIPKMVKEIVAAKERAKSRVEMERTFEQALNVRFWPPMSAKAVAESLAFIAADSDPKNLEKKLSRAETDPKFVSMLVCDWHVRNEIVSQLRSMGPGGASALKTMASLRDKWIVKIGIPTTVPATPEQRANVEKAATVNAKDIDAVRKLTESCKEASQELSRIWDVCEKMGNDSKKVSAMKSEATKYSDTSIKPSIERLYQEIERLPKGTKERKELESVLLELQKRKLAADILVATNFEKDQWGTARLLWSLVNEKGYEAWQNIQQERDARSRAFRKNLNPDQPMSLPTYDSSKWGNIDISIGEIEKDLKSKAVWETNRHTFEGYLSALYSLGMLTPERLKSAFWNRLQDAALHFGFKDDGTIDRDFGKSMALKNMIASWEKNKLWAANRFKEALSQSIQEQVNKERFEKAGGYPQLREYVRKKMAGKPAAETDRVFENLKSDIEKAKDGFEILVALRKHLGSDIRDKASLDAFFDEVTKCVVKDRRDKERLMESETRNSIPKGARLKDLKITPVALKLPAGSRESKDLEALMEKRFDAGMDDLTPEEETKIVAIIRKALTNDSIPKEDRERFESLAQMLEIRAKQKKERRKTDGTEASLLYADTREKTRAATGPNAKPEDVAKAKEAEARGADAISNQRDLLRVRERADIDVPQKDRDEVFKRLWYSSEAEVLYDDEKIIAAWGLLIKIEDATDIKKLKGFETVRNLLEKSFVEANSRIRASKWESGYVDFMLKAMEKADIRNEAAIRKLVEEGKLGKIYLDGASQNAWGNASEQRWTRSFFEWSFEAADTGGFLKDLAVGERVRISDGYSIAKTPTGVEFRTPEGKWRADGKEAVSAVSVAKSLHEAGADFLISSIPSITAAAWVWIKDGTFSASEERKTLSFMAEFFGIKGYDHSETDLAAVRSNFSKCLVSEGKTLVSKARDIGIMGDSGSLERLNFQNRLSQFETWKWKAKAESAPFA